MTEKGFFEKTWEFMKYAFAGIARAMTWHIWNQQENRPPTDH